MPIGREPLRHLAAEPVPHDGRHLRDRDLEGRASGYSRSAVQVDLGGLAGADQMGVLQRVAARGLPDEAISQLAGAGGDQQADRDKDKGQPDGDREPRMLDAPAPRPQREKNGYSWYRECLWNQAWRQTGSRSLEVGLAGSPGDSRY
jgi:hypothetical protein